MPTSLRKARGNLPPFVRKLLLTLHVTLSVGWLGAAAAYLAVAAAALASGDAERMRTAYSTLQLLGWFVILPLCLTALLSGVVQSLGTPWGLFRYYWVVAKLALTLVATGVLLAHLPAVSRAAQITASSIRSGGDSGHLPQQLVVHAAGGVLVLFVAIVLSVFKRWGPTPIGVGWQRTLGARARAGEA